MPRINFLPIVTLTWFPALSLQNPLLCPGQSAMPVESPGDEGGKDRPTWFLGGARDEWRLQMSDLSCSRSL